MAAYEVQVETDKHLPNFQDVVSKFNFYNKHIKCVTYATDFPQQREKSKVSKPGVLKSLSFTIFLFFFFGSL